LEALEIRTMFPATIESRDGSLKLFSGYMAAQGMADRARRQPPDGQGLPALAAGPRLRAHDRRQPHAGRGAASLSTWEATGVILVNPCPGIPLPASGTRLPKTVLTQKEARAVLDAPERRPGRASATRPSSKRSTRQASVWRK